MSDGELEREVKQLLINPSVKFPISSSSILAQLIAKGVTLRLSDRKHLETLLLKLAHGSKPSFISLKTDMDGVSVTGVHSLQGIHAGHKRKHSDLEDPVTPSKDATRSVHGTPTALISSADVITQEIFLLLQKGTARQKLLAEQVC